MEKLIWTYFLEKLLPDSPLRHRNTRELGRSNFEKMLSKIKYTPFNIIIFDTFPKNYGLTAL